MNIEVIRPASRLNSSGNVKITGLCYGREKLYVGFSSGDFSIYDVDVTITPTETKKAPLITLFKSLNDLRTFFLDNRSSSFQHEMSFSNINGDNSAISGIEIIQNNPSNNRIIFAVTSQDVIRVFEKVGSHLNLIQTIAESKGFSSYLIYETNLKKYMAIGVKKKLGIFEMVFKSRNLFTFQKIHEITLKEKVKDIEVINLSLGPYLILGLTNDFLLIDINDEFNTLGLFDQEENEEIHYYFNHSSFSYFGLTSSGPSIWILKVNDHECCLIKDNQVLMVSYMNDKFSVKHLNIKLDSTPVYAGIISPIYLLVVYNKRVEILELSTGDLIQKIHHQINSANIPVHVDNNFIFLGANNDLLQFNILDIQQQVDQFLKFTENTRGNKRDPKLDISLVGLKKSINLVQNIDEEDEFFGGSRVGKEKKKLLILRDLHKQIAIILFERYSKFHESLIEIGSDWLISYKDVLDLFPDFLKQSHYTSKVYESSNDKNNNGNMIKRITLEELEQNKTAAATSADSANEVEGDDQSKLTLVSRVPSALFNTSKSQDIRKFIKAINNLIIFLTDQRRIHLAFFNGESFTWKGVDITPSDLYDFISPEMVSSALDQITTEIDTSLFLCYFHCKPMLLGPLLRLPNNKCDSNIVNNCLLSHCETNHSYIKELLDFYYGRGLHSEALKMLFELSTKAEGSTTKSIWKSPSLTIQYLQKLSNDHLELILEYSTWLLTGEDFDVIKNGQLIFMNDTFECESYDNFKVLDYFSDVIENEELVLKYLEWIVFESDLQEHIQKSKTLPKFHTRLVLLYIEKLEKLGTQDPNFEQNEFYIKLYDFLKTSKLYEPWTVLKHLPTNEIKLLRFTIFVYKRLGEHDKAIDVLYNQLDDLDSAISYCADIFKNESRDYGKRLLHKLLEDLLMNFKENVDLIGKLLELQGNKMDSLRVLTSLPPSFPISKLSKFLDEQVRRSHKSLIDSRAASQLYKVGSIKLQHELLIRLNKSYAIDSSKSLCSICKKRLGYSVFTVSNNKIVHYACYQNETNKR